MKRVFLATDNVNRFEDICSELENPESRVGASMAIVTAPAGRGKSEAAKHYAANSDAVYIPPMNVSSPLMLLREISFDLCKIKPGRIEGCLNVIGSEMERYRRLVIIDEADLLQMRLLEMLRNVNERYACPILLIGEEELKGKIATRRRLSSRVRRRLEFEPVAQPDIVLFFRHALEADITSQPKIASLIQRFSRGDWRPVLTIAADVERAMKASGLKTIPVELIEDILGNGKAKDGGHIGKWESQRRGYLKKSGRR